MFGGFRGAYYSRRFTNSLWTLSIKSDGYFAWDILFTSKKAKEPSPRAGHCGWDYSEKLWVYGGHGPSPNGYLNDNGDFTKVRDFCNNQLLCLDPSTEEWINPKYSGSTPSLRTHFATAIIQEKVWLFGGHSATGAFDDLHELNMHSLVWAQIQTAHPKPRGRYCYTLNVISDSALVLHGDLNAEIVGVFSYRTLSDTWILDLKTQTFRQYTSTDDHSRDSHSGVTGLNSCVVIVGGAQHSYDTSSTYTTTFHVRLEPKGLQQLSIAIQTIYAHRTQLPWKHLPKKLINLLGVSDSEEDTEVSSVNSIKQLDIN